MFCMTATVVCVHDRLDFIKSPSPNSIVWGARRPVLQQSDKEERNVAEGDKLSECRRRPAVHHGRGWQEMERSERKVIQ